MKGGRYYPLSVLYQGGLHRRLFHYLVSNCKVYIRQQSCRVLWMICLEFCWQGQCSLYYVLPDIFIFSSTSQNLIILPYCYTYTTIHTRLVNIYIGGEEVAGASMKGGGGIYETLCGNLYKWTTFLKYTVLILIRLFWSDPDPLISTRGKGRTTKEKALFWSSKN